MLPDPGVAKDVLNIDLIRQQLATQSIGRRIILHEIVESTNASLRELADGGAVEGTVLLADSQTAGKGREHKIWFSPPGLNLYASILFRPPIAAHAAPAFTFIASLALAESIRELGGHVRVKWPNDVLVDGHKVGGVRTEMTTRGSAVDYIVVGVGVNLNVTHDMLRTALGEAAESATSVREALGSAVDRNAFTARFLTNLGQRLDTYRTKGASPILAAWRALGVDTKGHLRVKDTRKRVHTVVAGEVRLIP